MLAVVSNIFAAEIEVYLLDFVAYLCEEHRIAWRILLRRDVARLRRQAARAIELCRGIEDPTAELGGVLDIKQCLVLAHQRTLYACRGAVGTIYSHRAVGVAERGEDVKTLDGCPGEVDLEGVGVRPSVGVVDVNVAGTHLLVDNDLIVELRAEVVERECSIFALHQPEQLSFVM